MDPDNNYTLGPLQFSHLKLSGDLNVNVNVNINDLFSSNRSLTVNSAFAGGKLAVTGDLKLPSFGLSGKSSASLNLRRLSISHQLFTADIEGQASLQAGPLALGPKAGCTGRTGIHPNTSPSSPGGSLPRRPADFFRSANPF